MIFSKRGRDADYIIVDADMRYCGQVARINREVFDTPEHKALRVRYRWSLWQSRSKRPYRTLKDAKCRVRLKSLKPGRIVAAGHMPRLVAGPAQDHFKSSQGAPIPYRSLVNGLHRFGLALVSDKTWRRAGCRS